MYLILLICCVYSALAQDTHIHVYPIPDETTPRQVFNIRRQDTDEYYYFSANKTTWIDAYLDCMKLGGNLLEIESRDEHEVIQQIVKDLEGRSQDHFWVSCVDVFKEYYWVWLPTARQVDKRLWHRRKEYPTNAGKNNQDSRSGQHCGLLCSGADWTLEDRNCAEMNYYICRHEGQTEVCSAAAPG